MRVSHGVATMPEAAPRTQEEWDQDVKVLRECRALQKQVAELGLSYSILEVLVLRGHVSADLAARLTPGFKSPAAPCTRQPETDVLQRARTAGRISGDTLVAAQKMRKALKELGLAVSIVNVLLKTGKMRAGDLAQYDDQFDTPTEPDPEPVRKKR